MGLKNYRMVTKSVPLPDGTKFEVRGLSFADLTPIVREHGSALTALFGRGQQLSDGNADGALDGEDLSNLGLAALTEAPALVAAVIAAATVEADLDPAEAFAQVSTLPAPVQLEALEQVFHLTLATEGGLGKLVETVIRIMGGVSESLTSLTKPNES